MIRILIADDHEIVRQGLKQIVAEVPDMLVTGEASDASGVLALVRQQESDVLVLDITMPGRSGVEVLKELKQECPKLPVLILSMHTEDQYAVRVIKAGAAGYLTKRSAPKELIGAIRKVFGGGKYISQTLAEKLASTLSPDPTKALHENLSDREYQVMCMIAEGKRLIEIAGELSLSEKTISTYRARILEKMRMSKNSELIRYAMQQKLVE
jgi:two-component system, NarL family, invasion response regulator UvrY